MLVALAGVSILAQVTIIASAAWALANPRTVTDTWTVWNFEPSAVIESYAERAGLSDDGRFYLYASVPEVVPAEQFDLYCSRDQPGIGVLGCFTLTDARIYLYDITDADLEAYEAVVAAHETLHAVWDRLPIEERRELEPLLEEAFAALGPDHELVTRIAAYEEFDPTSRIPELYAILATEVVDLPTALEQHFARYFSDRSAVTSLYADVEAVFADLEERMVGLGSALDALLIEIQTEQASYAAAAAALEADIVAFNARASRTGGYTSQSSFERDRSALLARQSALDAQRTATNAKVDSYNDLLAELDELNAEAAELDRAVNIDRQPITTTGQADQSVGG